MDNDLRKEQIKETICKNLKEGMYKKDAARMAGISEDTYQRWYKEDADFADRVEASILEYKRSLIQNLNLHTRHNGMLALKVLQIRFPKDWNSPQYEAEESSTDKLVAKMDAILASRVVEDIPESVPHDFS